MSDIKMKEYGVLIKGKMGFTNIKALNKKSALDYVSRRVNVPKEDIILIGEG